MSWRLYQPGVRSRTVPELVMSVRELVVVQPGFPFRGVEGFVDGPTVCGPVRASAS